MLTDLRIRNFKSIRAVDLQLGRVTVLIGENGCGKSNLLEAIAMATAGAGRGDKLDQGLLESRGIRVSDPKFMRSAFSPAALNIELGLTYENERVALSLVHDASDRYSSWREDPKVSFFGIPNEDLIVAAPHSGMLAVEDLRVKLERIRPLTEYVIYSPENSALRKFEEEGQIQPLGIKGEGLFKLVKDLGAQAPRMAEIKDSLRLIDWFDDFQVPTDLAPFERHLELSDRYIDAEAGPRSHFDQRSANEGFLFLLFYFALFVSDDTPKFFAIDNIDASLNPKLCTELMRRLALLAKKYDKQVILTTHNPAILDGLNLHDDEQRLFAVHRTSKGHTKLQRISAPMPLADEPPVKLSEAFARGLLGGVPQNF